MRTKRGVARAVSAALLFLLCFMLAPRITYAATANSVTLFPVDDTPVVLDASQPYLVNNAGAAAGTLGQGGCTAYFHDGTLEIQGLTLTGSGVTTSGIFSTIYASDDLTIRVNGANTVTQKRFAGTGSRPSARTVFVYRSHLSITGSGSLTATVGADYGAPSYVVSALALTVTSGVSLTASIGAVASDGIFGITTEQLVNSGRVSATGTAAGIYLNASLTGNGARTSTNTGFLTATGKTGPAVMLASGATVQIDGGMLEATGASGMPAVGPSAKGYGALVIGSAITSGRMGTSKGSAAEYTARDITDHYNSAGRSYAYLLLSAPTSAPILTSAPIPDTGDGASPLLWLGLMLLSIAGIAATVVLRSREG